MKNSLTNNKKCSSKCLPVILPKTEKIFLGNCYYTVIKQINILEVILIESYIFLCKFNNQDS